MLRDEIKRRLEEIEDEMSVCMDQIDQLTENLEQVQYRHSRYKARQAELLWVKDGLEKEEKRWAESQPTNWF